MAPGLALVDPPLRERGVLEMAIEIEADVAKQRAE